MSLIRTFTMVAVLAAGTLAAADTPKPPPAKSDKTADKPGDKKPADTKKETISDADAQRVLAFFDKLVSIVVANKDDCTKMAAAINAHIDANQALIKEMNDAKSQNKEMPPALKEKILQKSRDELGPAMTAKCGSDKTVQAAFMRMKSSK
jgi:GTPase Era involved in 16S rRNA processing